jgi:hypothetical protein
MNQNEVIENKIHTFNLSSKEIEILFKYLSRAELKGVEVPEFNKLLNLFKIEDV